MIKVFAVNTILLAIVLFACGPGIKDREFIIFKNRFAAVKLPVLVTDSAVYENWSKANTIDSSDLRKFSLYSRSDTDYECSSVYRHETKKLVIIIYKVRAAKDSCRFYGLLLASFSKSGGKMAERVMFYYAMDPLAHEDFQMVISDDHNVHVKRIIFTNGILNGDFVIRRKTEKTENYFIEDSGAIDFKSQQSREIFVDKNPNIWWPV